MIITKCNHTFRKECLQFVSLRTPRYLHLLGPLSRRTVSRRILRFTRDRGQRLYHDSIFAMPWATSLINKIYPNLMGINSGTHHVRRTSTRLYRDSSPQNVDHNSSCPLYIPLITNSYPLKMPKSGLVLWSFVSVQQRGCEFILFMKLSIPTLLSSTSSIL